MGAAHSRGARHSWRLHRRRREDRYPGPSAGQDSACVWLPTSGPDEATAQLQKAVAAACPKGVTAEFKPIHSAPPSLVNPDNRFIHAAADAMHQVFGKETVYIRSGGSIPIVAAFDEFLGIPSVMMGFGLPDDNLHAPNEKLHLPNFFRGIEAVARYLEILGK